MAQSSRIERQITNLIRHAVDPDLIEPTPLRAFGTPDLASLYAKVAVFIDGCYWHGCPEHRADDAESASRRARDEAVNDKLAGNGWTVLRVWEHEEHLAPFIAEAASAFAEGAARARQEVLRHIASHTRGSWCTTCELWPHDLEATDEEGDCTRCGQPPTDHAWEPSELKLYGTEATA